MRADKLAGVASAVLLAGAALRALTSVASAPQTPEGVPAGGDENDLLAKASGTDYDTEWIDPASVGVTDHGALTGLGDDDHAQYLKEKASGGAASEIPVHTHADASEAGTIDHGALTGLSDNDHPQYQLAATAATDAELAAAIAAHEGAADPHPGYLTTAEGSAAFQPLDGDLTAIAALATTAFGRAFLTLANIAAAQAALDLEPGTDIATQAAHDALVAALAAHLADASDAHDASAISVVPFATIAATTVQGALEEMLAEAGGGVTDHGALTGLADDDHPQYVLHTEGDATYQPLDSDLTSIAALTTTAFGRGLLELANQAALLAAAGAAAASHVHAGEDITSGTVADARIAATITRDSELTAAISAHEAAGDPHPTYTTAAEVVTAILAAIAAADGAGLSDNGSGVLAVNVDDSTIEISGDALRVKDGGITAAKVAADVATQAELDAHVNDATAAHAASAISASSATLSGTGTDVQAVLEELDNLLDDHSARHENGGADEMSIAGLDGTPTELANHLADATDAHAATAISVLDTGGNFTGTEVETVLAELSDAISGGGIPATIVDAKGDLIVASAADAVDNLGVGDDDDVLTADASAPLGVKWAPPSGGPGGGSGEALESEITQTAHGFSAGDVVYLDGADYTLAQADDAVTAEVVGIVSAVGDANTFTLHYGGRITTLSGLTAGTVYFLDDATAGLLTDTEPTAVGSVSKPLLIADSTTSGYFVNMRGAVIGDISAANMMTLYLIAR